jgi:uncharacterized protein (TIGR02996 family)
MTPQTAFLHAIQEAPDDDALRLVFADWLEENGDARGPFLRAQTERAAWVPDLRRRNELHRLERRLLAAHGESWMGDLAGFCRSWRFERGFAHVTMEARRFFTKRFRDRGPRLLRDALAEGVRLIGVSSAHLAALADAPQLQALASLDLGGNDLDDDAARALALSPHLGRLTRLGLANNRIGGRGVRALAKSPHLGRLTWLDLRNNWLLQRNAPDLRPLLDSPLGRRLRRLDLHGADLDRRTAQEYAQWRAERDGDPPRRLWNALGMELALIPAGSFLMGSPEAEPGRRGDEDPQHEVEITRPFYLGVCQVTQGQYTRLKSSHSNHFDAFNLPEGVDPRWLPVDSVAPADAFEFCRQLSALPEERRRGRVYRLPTEAEWEHACRAGGPPDEPFSFGTSASAHQINCKGREPYRDGPAGPERERPTVGGTFEPNAFGLFDMHGNLWDWVADWYSSSYFSDGPRVDPRGPEGDWLRVLKGGSWFNGASWCRSASRFGSTNNSGSYCISFRVALDAGAP